MSKTRRKQGDPAPVVQADSSDDNRPRDRERDRQKRREESYASLGIRGELQGAARYSLLNIPEPVAAADGDFNRAISLNEFRQAALARFQLLDSGGRGSLTLVQLEALPHAPSAGRKRQKWDKDGTDPRIGNPLPTGP